MYPRGPAMLQSDSKLTLTVRGLSRRPAGEQLAETAR
jgi:hypothetical protein